MPQQEAPFKRQVRKLNRPGNQIRKQRQSGVGGEESVVKGIQRGIEELLNSRNVDFRVFDEWMIAMDKKRYSRKQEQNCESYVWILRAWILREIAGRAFVSQIAILEDCRLFPARSNSPFPAPVYVLPR